MATVATARKRGSNICSIRGRSINTSPKPRSCSAINYSAGRTARLLPGWTVKKALVKMGLHWKQSNIASGVIACTGNSYCKFAQSNTKGHALELIKFLEKKFELDQPINIHLTGCPNSCAQHYMGDIGLLGV